MKEKTTTDSMEIIIIIKKHYKQFYAHKFDVCVCAHSVLSSSLQPHRPQPTRLLCPWDFPGKNTGAGCHFLLQGIFLTRGSNPSLWSFLHWEADSLPLHHLENKSDNLRLNRLISRKTNQPNSQKERQIIGIGLYVLNKSSH